MRTSMKLDGMSLPAQPVEWTYSVGSTPSTVAVVVFENQLEKLISKGGSVELVMDVSGRVETIKRLYVLHEVPLGMPDRRRHKLENVKAVLLADVRYKWNRRHVKRMFNIRRKTGDRRWTGNQMVNDPIVDDIAYAPFSLKDGKAYTLKNALDEIMEIVDDIEKSTAGSSGGTEIDVPASLLSQEVVDFEFDENAASSVDRILGKVGGLGVTVDGEGKVIVFDTNSFEEEKETTESTGTHPMGNAPSFLSFVDLRNIRPVGFEVLFTREQEFRFNAEESILNKTVVLGQEDELDMVNVLPIPDPFIDFAGRRLYEGTYMEIESYLIAINALGQGPTLNLSDIRERYMWDIYWLPWTGIGSNNEDQIWMKRVNAIKEHFRQTYQINPRWMSRIYKIFAHRVSIQDPENALRAPSLAWSDYFIRSTERGLDKVIAGTNVRMGEAKDGGEFVGYNDLIENAKPAQAEVKVVDSDLGIISITYLPNKWDAMSQVLPGKIDNYVRVKPSSARTGRNVIVEQFQGRASKKTQLAQGFKVATILTAIGASPNNQVQLYKRSFKTTDLSGLIPGLSGEQASNSKGPVWQIRIGLGLESARFAWSDSRAPDIKLTFGVPTAVPDNEEPPDLSDLIVNGNAGGATGPKGDNFLDELAIAAIRTAMPMFIDRFRGDRRTTFTPGKIPKGAVGGVTYRMDLEGGFTIQNLPAAPEPRDFMNLLPDSVRRVLQAQPQP